jgi:DnaJ like chaperone protein
MGWIGKIVGGTLGFALGGPLGAIAGAAFGHAYDRSQETVREEEPSLTYSGQQAQLTFFLATFSMLAKLAGVDGRISRQEIDTVQRFMLQELRLDPRSRLIAMNIFQAALESSNTFEEFAAQFYGQFYEQPEMLRVMIDILIRVSVSDGDMTDREERLVRAAVRIFGFSESVYQQLKSQYVRAADSNFAVLGVSPAADNEEIKRRYRQLAMEYHPDRIVSKGLPEEFTKFAQEKFQEIQNAYEAIKKERGIK